MKHRTLIRRSGEHSAFVAGGPVSAGEKVQREGQCRMCERSYDVRRPTEHHLIPKRMFARPGQTWQGPDGTAPLPVRHRNAPANVVPLCRLCHDRIDNRKASDRQHARRELRARLSQAEVAFVIRLAGRAWLDRHYPPR